MLYDIYGKTRLSVEFMYLKPKNTLANSYFEILLKKTAYKISHSYEYQ